MDFHVWLTYFVTTLVFSLYPGSGMVNTVSNAIRYGVKGSLPAIAGLQLGLSLHLLLVGVGLGTIVAQSALAFTILKWFGVAYLVWLGITKWREIPAVMNEDPEQNQGKRPALFWQSVFVNLTNPKSIVFLVALFPQFLHNDVGYAYPLWSQALILSITCVLVDTAVMIGYASVAAPLKHLVRNEKSMRTQNRIFGSLFVAAGALLSMASR